MWKCKISTQNLKKRKVQWQINHQHFRLFSPFIKLQSKVAKIMWALRGVSFIVRPTRWKMTRNPETCDRFIVTVNQY